MYDLTDQTLQDILRQYKNDLKLIVPLRKNVSKSELRRHDEKIFLYIEEEPVGFIIFEENYPRDGVMYLDKIEVLSKSKGLGTYLMKNFIDYSRAHSFKYIKLFPYIAPKVTMDLDKLIEFYKKFGFKEDGQNMVLDLETIIDESKLTLQSVLFDKSKYDKNEAENWLSKHGYKHNTSRSTHKKYRFRQSKPNFKTYRSKEITDGITFLYGIK